MPDSILGFEWEIGFNGGLAVIYIFEK